MDNHEHNCDTAEPFKKTLAKSFAQSVVGTAGTFLGVALAGVVIGRAQKRREAREAQETTSES